MNAALNVSVKFDTRIHKTPAIILKGSQRSGSADLAAHLSNQFDNEEVQLLKIYKLVSRDLSGAFAEIEASASGTMCKKPLFSLSINPSSPITSEQLDTTIHRIAETLGLSGQPFALVYHRKNGRNHYHGVWSRIDREHMKAIHLPYFKFKLTDLSRALSDEFDLVPPKPEPAREPESPSPDQEPSLADNAQAQNTGITKQERIYAITEAYIASDNGKTFRNALFEMGYHLAIGTKRVFVLVDRFGQVYSLSRYIKGVRSKHIKRKLADLDLSSLPNVDQVKAGLEKPPAPRDDIELRRKLYLTKWERRIALEQEEQSLLMQQASERLIFKAKQWRDYDHKPLYQFLWSLLRFTRNEFLNRFVFKLLRYSDYFLRRKHRKELEQFNRRHILQRNKLHFKKRALNKLERYERKSYLAALRRLSRKSSTDDGALRSPLAHQKFKNDLESDQQSDDPVIDELDREFGAGKYRDLPHDDPETDPEIEALEKEYSWVSLTYYFNGLANPTEGEDQTEQSQDFSEQYPDPLKS